MFDIGWPELLVVAIVLIVVVGPKDLPRMLRTFGKTTKQLRSMAGDFRRQFDDALKEAELDDVKNMVNDARKLDPTSDIKKHLDPMKKVGDQIKAGLDTATKSQPAKPASSSAEPSTLKSASLGARDEKPAPLKKPGPKVEPKASEVRKTAPKKARAARKPASRSGSTSKKPGAAK